MATLQELQTDLKKLQDAFALIKDNQLKGDIQVKMNQIESEILMQGGGSSTTQAQQGQTPFMAAILSTLRMQMQSGSGSGVDSSAVRALIETYLRDEKVKLSELDDNVIKFIKENQTVELSIPNFPKKITINKDVANIPNLYQIIDDVLAGCNVYLIGEAGGGKTYTAEKIAEVLGRISVTLNCSQYTSPLEILGGQSVDGFMQGKLIDCWRNGKILIMDEMPKLDPNTAGLFNDALAKSSKTDPDDKKRINSANAEEAPIPRAKDFAIIATGNIYPNEPPAPQYRGNNQQDLSLLDRFSGSVYYTEFDKTTDQNMCRFQFLYDFLVGNYYEYIKAKKDGTAVPPPKGLRTEIEDKGWKSLSLVSYRTIIAFRVGFEYELVRAIAKKDGNSINIVGKTLSSTFQSYLVAFRSNASLLNNLITNTGYTEDYVKNLAETNINTIINTPDGFIDSLTPYVKANANPLFKRYNEFYTAQFNISQPTP